MLNLFDVKLTCNTKEWSPKKAVTGTSQTNMLVLYRVSSMSVQYKSYTYIYIYIQHIKIENPMTNQLFHLDWAD